MPALLRRVLAPALALAPALELAPALVAALALVSGCSALEALLGPVPAAPPAADPAPGTGAAAGQPEDQTPAGTGPGGGATPVSADPAAALLRVSGSVEFFAGRALPDVPLTSAEPLADGAELINARPLTSVEPLTQVTPLTTTSPLVGNSAGALAGNSGGALAGNSGAAYAVPGALRPRIAAVPPSVFVEIVSLADGALLARVPLEADGRYRAFLAPVAGGRPLIVQATAITAAGVTGYLAAPLQAPAGTGSAAADLSPGTTLVSFATARLAGVGRELAVSKGFRGFRSRQVADLVLLADPAATARGAAALGALTELQEAGAGAILDRAAAGSLSLARAAAKAIMGTRRTLGTLAAASNLILDDLARNPAATDASIAGAIATSAGRVDAASILAAEADLPAAGAAPLPGVPGPAITAVTPAEGPYGTIVTIGGENFGAGSDLPFEVTVGGVAAQAERLGETEIRLVIPAGAPAGDIVVTVAGQASPPATFILMQGVAAEVGTAEGDIGLEIGGGAGEGGEGIDLAVGASDSPVPPAEGIDLTIE